jgi:hypothetical protein
LGGELFGPRQQPEHDVLGPDVVVPERARLVARCAERDRNRAGEPERWIAGCRIGEGSEPLLCCLFAGSERAADFRPTNLTIPTASRSG